MKKPNLNSSKLPNAEKFQAAYKWFDSLGWHVFPFQEEAWTAYSNNKSGLINAPTGSGKTYSLVVPILLDNKEVSNDRLYCIWVSPIKALTKEIKKAAERAIEAFGMDWRVGIRSGDTTSSERAKQLKNPPQILITTPESIHVMMCQKGYSDYFSSLISVVVDEWHELIGSKRGVQVELLLQRFRTFNPLLRIWGISATIGNMEESMDVLLGVGHEGSTMIRSNIEKRITVETLKPDKLENFPWTGHLGLHMAEKLIPLLEKSGSTLIFVNTRAMCEIWYQRILELAPDLAGNIAMHHGSIDRKLRDWVEDALHTERIKAVCCTSSLDLGVDFRPVETIIQIGSPKGVARFKQRAGRSGHRPGAVSKIVFVPTHALELMEAAALRLAVQKDDVESRTPYIRSFDVLLQFMMTLAVSEGFDERDLYQEIKRTHCFGSLDLVEWKWLLDFLVYGGKSLAAYDEYKKVEIIGDRYFVTDKLISKRHKMSIGTISSSTMVQMKLLRGRNIGSVEEYFISRLEPGDVFWFAGQNLEFVRMKSMTAIVRKSKKKAKTAPSYMGGRMSLSSELSQGLRDEFNKYHLDESKQQEELKYLRPLFDLQNERSFVVKEDELLVEYFEDKEGYHLLVYPFEGRQVHEGLGVLLARRISKLIPITFTIAMNDYGFELLSDQRFEVEKIFIKDLFDTKNLQLDIQGSINASEMSRRKFRDIAKISGLVFQGFPGKLKKERHLQSSSQLIYDVFREYEPDNLLYLQTYDEVLTFELEEVRLREALARIRKQKFILSYPEKATPFSFPIIVDRWRASMSSEKLSDRVRRMTKELEA